MSLLTLPLFFRLLESISQTTGVQDFSDFSIQEGGPYSLCKNQKKKTVMSEVENLSK
jgi:hypothetical protein